ncbi:hypothetical protein AAMO2058_000746600 [Amorphochlora amoebiformis]
MADLLEALWAEATSGQNEYDEKKWEGLNIWPKGEEPMKAEKVLEKPDDYTLQRFLDARKSDPIKAGKMLATCLEWRRQNIVKYFLKDELTIREDPEEIIYRALCPHATVGFTKTGLPIFWERTGLVRVPELVKYVDSQTLLRRHVRHMELCTTRMKKSARRLSMRHLEEEVKLPAKAADLIVEYTNPDFLKQVVVCDLAGMSFAPDSTGMSIFRSVSKIDQNFYPERLSVCFFINAPWIFTGVWAVVKHFLDPVTQQKIRILGSGYQEALIEVIGEENVLKCYGGKLEEPDSFRVRSEEEKTKLLAPFKEPPKESQTTRY